VEDTDNGLVRDGHPITLPEARNLWKADMFRKWEEDWAEYPLSQWTHSLFPTVESTLKRDCEPSFWSSQAMTGHGAFRAHLAGRSLASSDACPCGFGPEPAEHVLRDCLRFTSGQLMDLDEVTVDYVQYLATVTRLWELENPTLGAIEHNEEVAGGQHSQGGRHKTRKRHPADLDLINSSPLLCEPP